MSTFNHILRSLSDTSIDILPGQGACCLPRLPLSVSKLPINGIGALHAGWDPILQYMLHLSATSRFHYFLFLKNQ